MDVHYQVAILGTGITESILAASLAKAGVKVLHVDPSPYYGANEASLTTDELRKWVEEIQAGMHSGFSSASFSGEAVEPPRAYSLSISPSVIVSTGPFISSLINSGVSRYGGFKLLENVCFYASEMFKQVPASKEEIFKSKDLSLLDKRKLMRFLMFATSEFENSSELAANANKHFPVFLQDAFFIDRQLASTLTYALAFCENETEFAEPALRRIRRHLRSTGRYGPSPFLIGQYGGLGELAQGFCRVCAVSGGTYILGRRIVSVGTKSGQKKKSDDTDSIALTLDDVPEALSANLLITSFALLPKLSLGNIPNSCSPVIYEAHGIVVLDDSILSLEALTFANDSSNTDRPLDSALLIFPPENDTTSTALGPVNVLVNGEGTLSCPPGRSILYLTTTLLGDDKGEELSKKPELLLRPYLDIVLGSIKGRQHSHPRELLGAFFTRTRNSCSDSFLDSLQKRRVLVCPDLTSSTADSGDMAAVRAESLFRKAMDHLGLSTPEMSFWPPMPPVDDDDLVE